jgi:hypothetical protein
MSSQIASKIYTSKASAIFPCWICPNKPICRGSSKRANKKPVREKELYKWEKSSLSIEKR